MTDAGGEPVAEAGMLIRRPVAEVFEAFVDPAVTTRFWFTRSSGRLEPGARVRWDWEVYGVGTQVEVQAVEPCRRIRIVWDAPDDPTTVEWTFDERGPNWTLVSVVQSGFDPAAEDVVAKVADSSGGFALVLAGAKAWLEHGLALTSSPTATRTRSWRAGATDGDGGQPDRRPATPRSEQTMAANNTPINTTMTPIVQRC